MTITHTIQKIEFHNDILILFSFFKIIGQNLKLSYSKSLCHLKMHPNSYITFLYD